MRGGMPERDDILDQPTLPACVGVNRHQLATWPAQSEEHLAGRADSGVQIRSPCCNDEVVRPEQHCWVRYNPSETQMGGLADMETVRSGLSILSPTTLHAPNRWLMERILPILLKTWRGELFHFVCDGGIRILDR